MARIDEQLRWASDVLYAISCSARLDSEVLLAHCLDKDRSYLLTWPEKELTGEQLACFRELVRRRLKPEPVAYLVGGREFYSMMFETTPATLVPRPETELLVEVVLERIRPIPGARVLELGTGTGAIALAIRRHHADCRVTATDISEQALAVARRNTDRFGLDVDYLVSDWYRSIPRQATYDVIVSNPPYIAETDPCLSQGDLPAEPFHALCSGHTGLEALEVIIRGAGAHLKTGGMLAVEHGFDQQQQVQALFRERGFGDIQTRRDFNDLPRVSSGILGYTLPV
jgi:release factor glutamine methyltransferase